MIYFQHWQYMGMDTLLSSKLIDILLKAFKQTVPPLRYYEYIVVNRNAAVLFEVDKEYLAE